MPGLDTASPEQLKAALLKSGAAQEANIKLGHTAAEPVDFGGIDEPDAGEADTGMGRFGTLESDPEGGETVTTDDDADLIAAADEGDTQAVRRDPEEIAELRVRAEEYGIDDAEIAGMRPAQLEKILDRFDSHVDGIASAHRAPPDPALAAAAAAPARAEPATATKAEQITLSEDADPDLAVIAKAVNALTGQIASMKTDSVSQQETNLTQQVNLQFEALSQRHGKEATRIFGGSGKMRPAQRVNRENVHKEIALRVQGHRAIGGAMPEPGDLFDTALRSTLGEKYAKLVSGKREAAVAQRQTQHLQRPHSRAGGKPVSGTKKAVQSVARLMRDRGMTSEDVALSDEETFATL